jgi:hypothetical protein
MFHAGCIMAAMAKSQMTGSRHAARGQFRALEFKVVKHGRIKSVPGGCDGSKPLKSLETFNYPQIDRCKIISYH